MRLIDADKLKERLYVAKEVWSHRTHPKILEEEDIDDMPTIDPLEHGYWEFNSFDSKSFHCTNCGYGVDVASEYCPNCGAKIITINNLNSTIY